MTYITGETIKKLREKNKLTQKQLAEKLTVSDKTVSKWETNRGLPDISILEDLAKVLSISVSELLNGDIAKNNNICANMKRSNFYVCPICGNIIHAMGEGVYFCCGSRLPLLEEKLFDSEHKIIVDLIEDELFVHLDHPMEKEHYISFIAYVTDNYIQMEKIYPEQMPQFYFRKRGHGKIFIFCNQHKLFYKAI